MILPPPSGVRDAVVKGLWHLPAGTPPPASSACPPGPVAGLSLFCPGRSPASVLGLSRLRAPAVVSFLPYFVRFSFSTELFSSAIISPRVKSEPAPSLTDALRKACFLAALPGGLPRSGRYAAAAGLPLSPTPAARDPHAASAGWFAVLGPVTRAAAPAFLPHVPCFAGSCFPSESARGGACPPPCLPKRQASHGARACLWLLFEAT